MNRRNNELYHFGIKGQKWGIRRYQNKDGSLTEAGKKRISYYNKSVNEQSRTVKSFEYARDSAIKERDEYLAKSKKTKARNLYYAGQRYVATKQLNKKVSDLERETKHRQNKLNNTFKKMNKEFDDNIEMHIYLSDIWGLPFDYYDIHEKKS